MTRITTPAPRRPRPRGRLSLDPYVVQGTTWTREELLRARGMTVDHPAAPKRHGHAA